MDKLVNPRRRASETPAIADLLKPYQCIALVLQGGGALGAYQAGVFEALSEAGIQPNWLSGVSIGGINAAIIAGNEPENQIARLREFWETVSSRKIWRHTPDGDMFRSLRNQVSAYTTMSSGLPGFFEPRRTSAWAALAGAEDATSFYDTSLLRETLNRLIDWNLLNSGTRRLSVGAVNVRTGNFRYFDNAIEPLSADHIMASGALPPAFPAIKVDNEFYWDGGIVSNTPLQYLLELDQLENSLVFQVDLFSARGEMPREMAEVLARQKDITYSSRTRNSTDTFRKLHCATLHLRDALMRLDPEQMTDKDREALDQMELVPQINILHLIYQQKKYEGHAKDYEFSGTSMREHWTAGLEDTRRTLKNRKWLEIPHEAVGMTVHDVHRDDPN